MKQFSKINVFGETVGKPTDSPTSRIGANNERQISVLYGHNNGGKAYTYLAGEGVRAGDTITPEVTHAKSGKTYKTLGRVVSTRNALSSSAQDTASYLAGKAITPKTLGSTDQTSLPGYYNGWDKDAKAAKELYDEARLGGASDNQLKETRAYTSSVRQEAKQKYDADYKTKQMKRLNILGDPI